MSVRPGNLELFGLPILDDFPARIAARLAAPIFVGGIFNTPAARSFGLDYFLIPPSDPASMRLDYAAAMEKTLMNNPADWIRFE